VGTKKNRNVPILRPFLGPRWGWPSEGPGGASGHCGLPQFPNSRAGFLLTTGSAVIDRGMFGRIRRKPQRRAESWLWSSASTVAPRCPNCGATVSRCKNLVGPLALVLVVGAPLGVVVLFVLCVGLVSHKAPPPPPPSVPRPYRSYQAPATGMPQTRELIDVTFDFSVDWFGNRPVINGKTNLPDGTEIMTSVIRKSARFMAQDRAVVRSGRFRAGPFGPASGLVPGVYEAGATMPFAFVQPPGVRAIIGDKGENLRGSLVERHLEHGASISVEKSFTTK